MRFSAIDMKLIFAIVVYAGSAFVVASAYGQSKPCPPNTICDPLKFDEYGSLTWSDEKARLDNLAVSLRGYPVDVGAFFFIYAGRNAGLDEARARGVRTKTYLVQKRGIKPARIVWIDGGYREQPEVQIWILPLDIGKPEPYPTVDRNQVHVKNCAPQNRRRRRNKS